MPQPRIGRFIPPAEPSKDKRSVEIEVEETAVPKDLRRRLKTVLDHLAASKEGSDSCSIGLTPQGCDSTPSGVDIEDLGSSRRPPTSGRASSPRLHSGHFQDDNEAWLFDPERFKETQKPLLEASTFPPEPYSSNKWLQREYGRVFQKSWMLVGRANEIAEPGQYLAVDTEWGGPVVVCRGKDYNLHAFANVCRHRGAKVVPDGPGKASPLGLICPYHAWTYEFTGNLKWAPGMHQAKNFDEDSISLAPVRMDTFCGFIFVCHSAEGKSLAEAMGNLPELLPEWFGPEGGVNDMVVVARREYNVPCNWKFLMENTTETYHTSVVHKSSLGPMKSSPVAPHVGDWDGVWVETDRTVVPLPDDLKGVKFPFPAFTDKTAFVAMFPCVQVNCTWDCVWWMNLLPTGEHSTRIVMGFCFPPETARLDHFPETVKCYMARWNTAVSEDNAIALNQERGVRSTNRVPGRFCRTEFGTHNFNNWLLANMLDGQTTAWDPGSRLFVQKENASWSNNDERMVELAAESEKIQKAAAL